VSDHKFLANVVLGALQAVFSHCCCDTACRCLTCGKESSAFARPLASYLYINTIEINIFGSNSKANEQIRREVRATRVCDLYAAGWNGLRQDLQETSECLVRARHDKIQPIPASVAPQWEIASGASTHHLYTAVAALRLKRAHCRNRALDCFR
jgi:hypothetical protein